LGMGFFFMLSLPFALALLLGLAIERFNEQERRAREISFTAVGPLTLRLQLEPGVLLPSPMELYSPQATLPRRLSIGLAMVLLGIAGLVCVAYSAHPDRWYSRNEALIFALATLSSLFFLWGGIGLLAVSAAQGIREALARRSKFKLCERAGYYYFPKVRRVLRPKFSTLPSFGLIAAITVGFVNILYLALPSWRDPRMGINVFLFSERILLHSALRTEPPLVRVIPGPDWQPRYYLNSKRIAPEQLSTALKAELKLRAEWVVYVDADRDLPYQTAVDVMDVIQGVQGKVVLLTPKTKGDAPQRTRARRGRRVAQN
jgi:hypothetical protein